MNDVTEEKYGFDGYCQHGINRVMCYQCTGIDSDPRTTLCRHGYPEALCNSCADILADTVEETVDELLN